MNEIYTTKKTFCKLYAEPLWLNWLRQFFWFWFSLALRTHMVSNWGSLAFLEHYEVKMASLLQCNLVGYRVEIHV